MKTLGQLGVKLPKILLPKILDIKTWATIACDQYTQDKDYWKQVYSIVGSKPSTVKITFPEVYLEEPGRQERIQNIKKEMKTYINQGVFASPEEEFVYLERTTRYGRVRHGLVVAVDLDTYEWKPFSKALIRATEATIVERIPPRMEIRKEAIIETPHIMLLVNDPNRKLVEGLGHRVKKNKPIYQGDLMMNSGSVKGWSISNEYDIEYFRESLQRLAEDNTQMDGSIFLFAVGDGNHSLATAKATWEEYKKNHPGIRNCNMKYALVEIVNIYDTGLTFEPIHRVLFDINPKALIDFIGGNLGGNIEYLNTFEELKNRVDNSKSDFGFIFEENKKPNFVFMKTNIKELPISQLQPAIDQFLISCNKKGSIDFIHGADELLRLGSQRGITAIYLPPIDKDSFFGTISGKGPLPRKSFSMGEADEKRFYLECRQIV
jgi:uncharacterized protein (DUF1015 family)